MTTWFVSDTHFNHRNILNYTERPWGSVEEMNEALIDGWNSVVGRNETVYHLGDITMGRRTEFPAILERLHGDITLVPGNHDQFRTIKLIEKRYNHRPLPLREIKVEGQRIVMCHFAMRIWNRSHHGSWHLYGHSHGNLEANPWGRSMDVGVDANAARGFGYRPISFEEVREVMNSRQVKLLEGDHHDGNTQDEGVR